VGAGSKHDQDGAAEHMAPTSRWGLGGALALAFATKYRVVLMGRRTGVLEDVAAEVTKAGGVAECVQCDVADDASVARAFEAAKAIGTIETVVFNAAPGFPKGFGFSNLPAVADVEPQYLQSAFDVGVSGCLRVARQVLPDMVSRKRGSILVSGATMALRGGKGFSFMSPVKFALRSLTQSLANEYAPQGVHCAHVVVDGVIHSPATSAWPLAQFHDPKELADVFLYLDAQPRSCWTHEIQVTPNSASIGMRL